jgi:asparagine synthase (glutamine-hydrolysing)
MCGIAGFQGAFGADLLRDMTDAVSHRGPDGEGRAIFEGNSPAERVGLGHRRLSIIDLSSAGSEPMQFACAACGSSAEQPIVLTYNGEIYNYRELRAGLAARGHSFGSQTDSEVLLHLYAQEGVDMLKRLNGIFAFAIYDGRQSGFIGGGRRGDLFVARDQLGVKPFYYSELRQGLLFGSELKAILQSADVSRDIDSDALHQTLAYLWTPAPRTLLKSVRKLEAGCAMVVREGKVARHWRYYDLPYGRSWLDEPAEDVVRRVHDAVEKAVARQMVADVPVGAFLSGGLDSSAVVAMMRKASPDRVHKCYTIGFHDGEAMDGAPEDLPYARAVAMHLGVPLEEIRVGADLIDGLGEMLYFLDEPQADPAPLNALVIARAAKRDGVKVLLSGTGGDDIFSGYRRHYGQRLEQLWRWLPRPARSALARGSRRLENSSASRTPLLRRAAKALAHADLPALDRPASYFWWGGEGMRRALYSPALTNELARSAEPDPLVSTLSRIPAERDPLNRMLYLEGKHFLPDHNLNYTDKMGMAEGVEIRVPLLDVDLVDLATTIHPRMKQRGTTGKFVFKRAMESELPASVIYRGKTGFGAPLRQWMRGQLKPRVDELLSAQSVRARGLFDPEAVRKLIEVDRAGKADASYTIFSLMCIELWCRIFVDPPTPRVQRNSL